MSEPMFKNDPAFRETVRQNLIEIQNEHKDNPYAKEATIYALLRLEGIDISTPVAPMKPRKGLVMRIWQWILGHKQ